MDVNGRNNERKVMEKPQKYDSSRWGSNWKSLLLLLPSFSNFLIQKLSIFLPVSFSIFSSHSEDEMKWKHWERHFNSLSLFLPPISPFCSVEITERLSREAEEGTLQFHAEVLLLLSKDIKPENETRNPFPDLNLCTLRSLILWHLKLFVSEDIQKVGKMWGAWN